MYCIGLVRVVKWPFNTCVNCLCDGFSNTEEVWWGGVGRRNSVGSDGLDGEWC